MANKKIKQDDLLNTLFFQVPKWLMDMFLKKQITQGGFKTYVLMYDRLKLSSYNNWVDKEGDVYIKYSYDELQEDLGCSRQAVSDNLKNLVKLDLVDKIKGFNTSSKFYLKIFTSKENLTSDSLENLTNSSKENLTTSSLENLDSNNNNFNKNKNSNNNSNKNNVFDKVEQLEIDEDLKEKLKEYIEFRKDIKKKITFLQIEKILNQLGKKFKTKQVLIDCIDESIMNGWQGLFPKETKSIKGKNKKNIDWSEVWG